MPFRKRQPSSSKSGGTVATSAAPPPHFGCKEVGSESHSSLQHWWSRVFRVHFWFGLLLLPTCYVTTETFFDCFVNASRTGLWSASEFLCFAVGAGAWVLCFFFLPRPVYLYVLGHELTHYFFIKLFGGKVHALKVSSKGGYVETDQTNLLIDLSPYFVPFFTVVILFLYILAGLLGKFGVATFHLWLHPRSIPLLCLFALIGLTWAFHLTFTVWMICIDQPDLKPHGGFFSLVLIYLINLSLISLLVLLAAPQVSFAKFAITWWENFRAAVLFFSGM